MKLDAKQRVCLAVVHFLMQVLFPFDAKVQEAWLAFVKQVKDPE
jgi:hypothetical protein